MSKFPSIRGAAARLIGALEHASSPLSWAAGKCQNTGKLYIDARDQITDKKPTVTNCGKINPPGGRHEILIHIRRGGFEDGAGLSPVRTLRCRTV
jgi:hypothetical protein